MQWIPMPKWPGIEHEILRQRFALLTLQVPTLVLTYLPMREITIDDLEA